MKHEKHIGKDFGKKGLTVDIRVYHNANRDQQIDAMDSAIKILKRRMLQEGVIKDLRKNEFYQSKGQLRRKAKAAGRARMLKAKELENMDPKKLKKEKEEKYKHRISSLSVPQV